MKTRFLTLAALVTIALAGCSKNEDVAVNVLPEDGLIRVTAQVNNLATRGGMDNENIDYFGLFITNSTNPTVTKYTYGNVAMIKEGGVWKSYQSDGTTPWMMLWNKASETVSVVAYSPYMGGTTIDNEMSSHVESNQSEADMMMHSDLLWAKSDVTPATPVTTNDIFYEAATKLLTVQMNHKLSKLRINIKYGTELTQGGATPTLGDVAVSGTRSSYTFDLNTGVVALNPAFADPTNITMFHETTDGSNFDAICEAILVPQGAKFSVKITVNGEVYVYTYPDASYTFESGKLYRLNLTVGKDVVTPGEITSSEWGNGTGAEVETE